MGGKLMMDILNRFRNEYYKIDAMQEPQRSQRLGQLLSSMEMTFNIPMLKDKDYNMNNLAVMALYREISTARNI